jgi:hypothetical protein
MREIQYVHAGVARADEMLAGGFCPASLATA